MAADRVAAGVLEDGACGKEGGALRVRPPVREADDRAEARADQQVRAARALEVAEGDLRIAVVGRVGVGAANDPDGAGGRLERTGLLEERVARRCEVAVEEDAALDVSADEVGPAVAVEIGVLRDRHVARDGGLVHAEVVAAGAGFHRRGGSGGPAPQAVAGDFAVVVADQQDRGAVQGRRQRKGVFDAPDAGEASPVPEHGHSAVEPTVFEAVHRAAGHVAAEEVGAPVGVPVGGCGGDAAADDLAGFVAQQDAAPEAVRGALEMDQEFAGDAHEQVLASGGGPVDEMRGGVDADTAAVVDEDGHGRIARVGAAVGQAHDPGLVADVAAQIDGSAVAGVAQGFGALEDGHLAGAGVAVLLQRSVGHADDEIEAAVLVEVGEGGDPVDDASGAVPEPPAQDKIRFRRIVRRAVLEKEDPGRMGGGDQQALPAEKRRAVIHGAGGAGDGEAALPLREDIAVAEQAAVRGGGLRRVEGEVQGIALPPGGGRRQEDQPSPRGMEGQRLAPLRIGHEPEGQGKGVIAGAGCVEDDGTPRVGIVADDPQGFRGGDAALRGGQWKVRQLDRNRRPAPGGLPGDLQIQVEPKRKRGAPGWIHRAVALLTRAVRAAPERPGRRAPACPGAAGGRARRARRGRRPGDRKSVV